MIPVQRHLYTLLYALLLPFMLLRLLWRARKDRRYLHNTAQRFARALPPADDEHPIWIHAVSLGEVRSVIPLAQKLRAAGHSIWMTTTTPAGRAQIRQLPNGFCQHSLLPFDLPGLQRRFVRHVNPALLILVETELWPNQLAVCRRLGVPSLLVNARLSAHSARGYARFKSLLADLDTVAARSRTDARRFVKLGVQQVQVTGDIKLYLPDAPVWARRGAKLRDEWGTAPLWIAGSTHPGEDELVLAAHRLVLDALPDARLIIAPRHRERVADVLTLAEQLGRVCTTRSESEADFELMVADTHGELPVLYAAADVAFVGGSLVPHGGHNLYEPVAVGTPVLCGQIGRAHV